MNLRRLIASCCVVLAASATGAAELPRAGEAEPPASSGGAPRLERYARLQEFLQRKLPLLGHRNWIVIADSAYPAQSRPGIETLYTGGDQVQIVAGVLQAVQASRHVRPKVFLDAELDAVLEQDAPGVTRYRETLRQQLKGLPVERILHEAIIERLDEAAKTFQILILKTDGTIPYTSVFLELDCAYWSPEAEQRVRQSVPAPQSD